ncbi:probable protein phosphatase 2C 25 [Arachis ipaensis]|uniref:probable protein phosphatase 2C 25 n=1 Tax=Arachis ipaensis TaxID=130454 RepID=UPI0007AFCCCB|nr:probable protein phosphatase 2C 25 [Arachis ipaensis]
MSNIKEKLTETAKSVCNSVAAKFSRKDPNMWSKEHGTYAWGEYSFAVVRANYPDINDRSQIEIGSNGLFVGIYDGHHGPKAASYLQDKLFSKFIAIARKNRAINLEAIKETIKTMENDFIHEARKNRTELLTTGSCCLIGMLYRGDLLYGSLGNSAIVFGTEITGEFGAEILTKDHSVHTNEPYRQIYMETRAKTDPDCICLKDGKYKIKGLVEVAHTIGDAYMKYHDCKLPQGHMHQIPTPLDLPYLWDIPHVGQRPLHNSDRFIIFASNGLWEHISPEEAVKIVDESHERKGIAKKLVEAAVNVAANKAKLNIREVHRLTEARRAIHDDITVAVIFINHKSVGKRDIYLPVISIKPDENEFISKFHEIEGGIMQ